MKLASTIRRPIVPLSILMLTLLAPSTSSQGVDERIAVFVAPATLGGFVDDKGVSDSIKDLQNEVRKRGYRTTFNLVPIETDAEIVIRVVRRGKDRGNFVVADMEVGDYRKDVSVKLSGIGDVWGECAEQIVKQVVRWIDANRRALIDRRSAPQQQPTTPSTLPGGQFKA